MIHAISGYFRQGCDKTSERVRFRLMKMKEDDIFSDWLMKLEKQAKCCEFKGKAYQEEMLQMLYANTVPEIGLKLYELVYDDDYQKAVTLANRLDQARLRARESISSKPELDDQTEAKAVNAVKAYRQEREKSEGFKGGRKWVPASRDREYSYQRSNPYDCNRCGRKHQPKSCPAFQKECSKCHKTGHFAVKCRGKQSEVKTEQKNNSTLNNVARLNKVTNSDIDSD